MILLLLAGCGGSGGTSGPGKVHSASESSSSTHLIHWQDEVTYSYPNANNAALSCNVDPRAYYYFKVFNEAGVAVASDLKATATADAPKVSEDSNRLTCRYTADVVVDDAKRYRAERVADNFEATWQYPTVLEYSFIEKSTLAANGWVWATKGGYPKG